MVKVDDGTGLLDLLVTSSAASAPGSDAASVGPGAYVLAQGRLQARPAPGGAALEYSVKVHKVGAGGCWWVLVLWLLGAVRGGRAAAHTHHRPAPFQLRRRTPQPTHLLHACPPSPHPPACQLLNLTKQCGEDAAQRMLSWGTEVAELQRLLEAEAAAA